MMLLRVVGAMLVVGVVLVGATGCEGGDKAADEQGQPDYAAVIISLFPRQELREAGEAKDLPRARDLLEQELETLRELDPPSELRSAHDLYVEAFGDFVGDLVGQIESGDGFGASEAEDVFREAFSEHYNVSPAFAVQGSSMEPAYAADDTLVLCEPDSTLERWQTVVFRLRLDEERLFVKRVVALPGETIEIRDGAITIDGAPVEGDEYALADVNYIVEPLTVPEGRYYVLGDNRRNSYDSHAFGAGASPGVELAEAATIPHDLIEGELPPGDAKICPTIAER